MHERPLLMALSDRLIHQVRLSTHRAYRLAQLIDVAPSTLSSWLNHIQPVKSNDPRVLKLARLMDVAAEEAFRPWQQPSVDADVALHSRRAS